MRASEIEGYCKLFHINVQCLSGDRGDAEGPPHDESGPRKTMDRGELLDAGTVTCWEITGEKDKKTKEDKRAEMHSFHGHTITWGLLQDIGEAFISDADQLGIMCTVSYEFNTLEQ